MERIYERNGMVYAKDFYMNILIESHISVHTDNLPICGE